MFRFASTGYVARACWYLQIDRIGPKPTFNTKMCGKVRLDVLIGPPRALTSGENLYSLTVRDRYTHTLGHTLLPKKPTTLPTRVLSALARVEGAAPAAGFHLPL